MRWPWLTDAIQSPAEAALPSARLEHENILGAQKHLRPHAASTSTAAGWCSREVVLSSLADVGVHLLALRVLKVALLLCDAKISHSRSWSPGLPHWNQTFASIPSLIKALHQCVLALPPVCICTVNLHGVGLFFPGRCVSGPGGLLGGILLGARLAVNGISRKSRRRRGRKWCDSGNLCQITFGQRVSAAIRARRGARR